MQSQNLRLFFELDAWMKSNGLTVVDLEASTGLNRHLIHRILKGSNKRGIDDKVVAAFARVSDGAIGPVEFAAHELRRFTAAVQQEAAE